MRRQATRLRLALDTLPNAGSRRWRWRIVVGHRVVGFATLEQIDPLSADYGIVITAPRDRDRGYGTETTRRVLVYAFARLKLRGVALAVDAVNARAIACYTRCGFSPVARVRTADAVHLRMVCPNPRLAHRPPLLRTLLLEPSLVSGRRVRLRRADLDFLGLTEGDPVAVEAAAGFLLIQRPTNPPPDAEAIGVTLPDEEHDWLHLTAARLGVPVSALIVEVLAVDGAAHLELAMEQPREEVSAA